MDRHDEQFEAFLRQFRLRQPSPLPELVSRNRWPLRFGIVAAAAVIVLAVASVVLLRNSAAEKPYATVELTGNPSIYKVGEKVEAGTVVRSNSAAGLMLALNDGSHVEMRAQSELLLESAADGIRVRLNDGGILVTAAKQPAGHLYVQTRDATISVVGTVFYVSAEQAGTKIAVVEGEVHVQHGRTLDKLLPGEQTATNPKIQLKSVAEEIAWSRSAGAYLAVFSQASATAQGGGASAQPSSPQSQQRDAVSDSAGRRIFDTACTTCHSADVAMKFGASLEPQFSTSDRGLLASKKAELAQLLNKGYTSRHPDVQKVQVDIAALEVREAAAKTNHATLISSHLRDFGGAISNADLPVLVDYLLNNDQVAQTGPRLSAAVLPFEVKASYVGNGDEVRTLITIQILTRDLAFQDIGGSQIAQANITGVIYDANNRKVPGFSSMMKIELPSLKARVEKRDQPNVFQETRHLPPGKYKLHLSVEDANSKNARVLDLLLAVPLVPERALQASSMILAYSIADLPKGTLGTEMFALGDKKIIPNVTGIFRRDQNLNVWLETYGLTVDPATRKPSVTFELVISQDQKEIKKAVTQSAEIQYTNSLPLKDLDPGPYNVEITVKDNLTKAVFIAISKFTVAASPTIQPQAPPPQQQSDSPNSAGPAIFNRACTTCHTRKVMDGASYSTRNEYVVLVNRQTSMGAMVSDSEFPILVDYLFYMFGKRTAPPVK